MEESFSFSNIRKPSQGLETPLIESNDESDEEEIKSEGCFNTWIEAQFSFCSLFSGL